VLKTRNKPYTKTLAAITSTEIMRQQLNNYIHKDKFTYEEINGEYSFEIKFNNQSDFFQIITYLKSLLPENTFVIVNQFNITNKLFGSEVDLSNCIFKEGVILENCIFTKNVNFKDCDFIKDVSFDESKFNEKIRFHRTHFRGNTSFNNTSFNKLVDFYWAIFYKTQQFHLTDFLGYAIFSNVTFKHQVQFLYNKSSNATFISFENTDFQQSFDISRSNFRCNIHTYGMKTNVFPSELWLYENENTEIVETPQTIKNLKHLRESYRRIKQEFRNIHNQIEALKFQNYEMRVYEKELWLDKSNKKNDLIILTFNKYSNNFGKSWFTGLVFTLIITFIFYTLFLVSIEDRLIINLSSEGFGNYFRFFFQFLNITSWDYKPFGVENYIWGYSILFIGRIFIGYGYFQTIQAFRKHSKN
jgi:hypothetical protein